MSPDSSAMSPDSSAPTVTNCKFIGNAVAGLRVVRFLAATDLSI